MSRGVAFSASVSALRVMAGLCGSSGPVCAPTGLMLPGSSTAGPIARAASGDPANSNAAIHRKHRFRAAGVFNWSMGGIGCHGDAFRGRLRRTFRHSPSNINAAIEQIPRPFQQSVTRCPKTGTNPTAAPGVRFLLPLLA